MADIASYKLLGLDDGGSISGQFTALYFSYDRFTSIAAGTCREIRVYCSGAGNIKVALYDSGGNRIGKHDASFAVSGPGWNVIPLEVPCAVASGQTYYIAYITDANRVCYHQYVSGVYHGYKGTYTFATFTFPDPMGSGFTTNSTQWAFVTGYSIAVYDDKGKVVVVKGSQGVISQPAIRSEVGKLQTVLIAQGKTDLATFLEDAKLQVVLVVVGEWDAIAEEYDETGHLQVILCTQEELDNMVMNEDGHPQIILATIGKSDNAIFSDVGHLQTVLAVITQTEVYTMMETEKLQEILAVITHTDYAILNETAHSQTILSIMGKTDNMAMDELNKPIIIIVEQGQSDSAIFSELASQTVLAVITHTDVVAFTEEGKLQVILSVLGGTGILLFTETGKLQIVRALMGEFDHLTATYMTGGALQFEVKKYPTLAHPTLAHPRLKYPLQGKS